jgi:uncharacterized membrane protein YGL010W
MLMLAFAVLIPTISGVMNMKYGVGTMGALAFVGTALGTMVTHEKPWWKLDESFAFYAQFHQDKINQLIHFFCIWPIFATFMPIFGYTDNLVEFVPYGNVSFLIAVVYAAYYLFLCRNDAPMVGAASAGLALASWYGGNHYAAVTDQAVVFRQAIAVNVVCWIAQFVGHGKFEGSRPALFQNLGQSLVMAPLFVAIEAAMKLGKLPHLEDRLNKILKPPAPEAPVADPPEGKEDFVGHLTEEVLPELAAQFGSGEVDKTTAAKLPGVDKEKLA